MTKRCGLKDEQWEKIKDLLPGREGTVGVTAKDNRLFVEAVNEISNKSATFCRERFLMLLHLLSWYILLCSVALKPQELH